MPHRAIHCLTLFMLLIFSSCQSPGERHIENQTTNTLATDTLLAKTITFPLSLFQLKGEKSQTIDSVMAAMKEKKKIISIVDGNCMKCIIEQLNKMDSTFSSIMPGQASQLIFVINVHSADSAFFMRNLRPAIKANGIIFYDNNYNFEKANKLFTADLNLRTFMVNKQNRIVHYGNPLLNPASVFNYQEKLKNE